LIVGEITVCRGQLASSLASSIRKVWMRQMSQMALSVAELTVGECDTCSHVTGN
jgi:hypothetical protein